jgi:hypothetical protein
MNDVADYKAALLEAGTAVEIPDDPKGLDGKLCQLAEGSYRLGERRDVYPRGERDRSSTGYMAPKDVALALAHGRFTDGKRHLLVLPPDDAFLAKVSEWSHWAWRHLHMDPVGNALSALTYGLSLGSTPAGQHYTHNGKKTGSCYAKHVGTLGYAPLYWFEIRIPKPESHGLPGPCFLRLLRCEACGDVVNIYVLRGESRSPACEDKPDKKAEVLPSRIMVPNRKEKPIGWLLFDAWSPTYRTGRHTCVGNLRWEK